MNARSASTLTNGGTSVELNAVQAQLDKLRFTGAPSQQQQLVGGGQPNPIGPGKTAASIVAQSLKASQQAAQARNGYYYGPPPPGAVINENDFPSLGVRQSPSLFMATTSNNFGGHSTPTAASIAAGLASIPSYGSKDASGSIAGLQRTPYSSLMRQGYENMGANEFNIQNEDFPALPGAPQNIQNVNPGAHNAYTTLAAEKEGSKKQSANAVAAAARGIQTNPNGRVTNIPPGMLNDQYGMAGVLTFLRTIDKSQGLVQLALGHDLTNLGLNLNSPERNLYQSFGGPFCDTPARTQDIECAVPEEYRTSHHIKDKLPQLKLSKLGDDTLFFLFYNCPNEAYQMVAAHELYMRDWRYHKTLQAWLTRSAYGGVKEQTAIFERGSYNVFDPVQWRKIPKEMTLEYKELEQRPNPPINDIKPPQQQQQGAVAPAQMLMSTESQH
uniref:NOT2_3_5 domain-containing protein n=1 Tax=Panagrellus redivivus TaxID=6233 RepID=A0A7E4VXJ5_PANRE